VKQFILNNEPDRDNLVRLEGDDYRYLVRVRRLATGEIFPALLPSGAETLVQVLSIDHNTLTGKCHSKTSTAAASIPKASQEAPLPSAAKLPPIILFQALPKGDKMDLIVRQAAEGAITEIVPFVSEFSVAKTKADGHKFSRWERIVKEARQQSGSKIATSIRRQENEKLPAISELFEYWEKIKAQNALGLLFHHQGLEPSPKSEGSPLAQESLHSYLDTIPSAVALAIGPEGGFSEREAAAFLEKGFKPFTIGDTILRTETAALYCAAAVRIILLERDSWELKQLKSGSV